MIIMMFDNDNKRLSELEQIVRNENWQIVYTESKDNIKPHWGANTKERILYIFNTKDYRYVQSFVNSMKVQYVQK